ncbi:MAG: MlaD family protein [Elusimicrobia bacterium]|nr:MlaD family protein [Elusimicrobiota bacterium]
MRTRSEIKAGTVILAALFLAGVILVASGNWSSLFKKKQTLHILFTDVQGLQVEDPVRVMGLKLGKVTGIEVTHFTDEAGRRAAAVEVTASITYAEPFSNDTSVAVDRTLTGITVLTVVPGRAAVKLAAGEKITGDAPVAITELAKKAGTIVRRIDDFVALLADKEMAGAAHEAVVNLKETSALAKSVLASLNRSIPAAEQGIVNSVKNLEQLSGSVAGSKERIADTLVNFHAASESLARAGKNVDEVMIKSRDPLIRGVANAEKATANLKALTRQVRWQPWLLLKKPDKASERERGIYNAALDFSEGADSLNDSVTELVIFMNSDSGKAGGAGVNTDKFKGLIEQAHDNLEKSVALERKLWKDLTGKGAKDEPATPGQPD